MRVADEVLVVPLHGVDPALQIKPVLNRVAFVGVADRRVDIVLYMIVADGLVENLIAMFCE